MGSDDSRRDDERERRRYAFLAFVALLLVTGGVAVAVILGGSGHDKRSSARAAAVSDLQTISFQQPTDPGPDPFTPPADREGRRTVALDAGGSGAGSGSGAGGSSGAGTPFGGSGSNVVCDRDRLIRFLRDHPDRRRAWAGVLGISSSYRAVRRYIARLHPVTLTRDTRVTNHTFVNGRAVPLQSILAAGTAVLVDDYGRPVVRCRCGNPLAEPVFLPQARCRACPPHYRPPPEVCEYWHRRTTFRRVWYRGDYYDNVTYDEVFIRRTRRGPFGGCWIAYPDPPTVTIVDIFRAPKPEPTPAATPSPGAAPRSSLRCSPPRSQYEFERCRDLGLLSRSAPYEAPHETTPHDTPPPTTTHYDPPAHTMPPTSTDHDPEPDPGQLPVCDPISPVPPCTPG